MVLGFFLLIRTGFPGSFRMVILVSFQVDGPAGTMEYQQSSSTSRTIQSSCRGVVLGWEVAVAAWGGNKILEMWLELKDSQSQSRLSVPSFGILKKDMPFPTHKNGDTPANHHNWQGDNIEIHSFLEDDQGKSVQDGIPIPEVDPKEERNSGFRSDGFQIVIPDGIIFGST